MPNQKFTSPFTGDAVQPTDVSLLQLDLSGNSAQLVWQTYSNYNAPPYANPTYVAARIIEITAAAAGSTITMPPPSQAGLGQDILITNISTNPVSILDYDGVSLATITPSSLGAAGSVLYFYLVGNNDTSSAPANWHFFNYGSAAPVGSLLALEGYGIDADNNKINTAIGVATINQSHTFQASDRAKLLVYGADSTSAKTSYTFTLPPSATLGRDWYVYLRNAGSATLALQVGGALDTIDNNTSIAMQSGESLILTTDGLGNFYTVGRGRSTVFQFSSASIDINTLSPLASGNVYTLAGSYLGVPILRFRASSTPTISSLTIELPAVTGVYYIDNDSTTAINIGFRIANTTNPPLTVNFGQSNVLVSDGTNLNVATPQITGGSVALTLTPGSVAGPSLNFEGDYSLGLYHPTTGVAGIAGNGSDIVRFVASGVSNTPKGVYVYGVLSAKQLWGGTF